MRASLFAFLSFVILFPGPLNAQSTLTFARVMDFSDLPLTGFAIVNVSTTSASVTFALRGPDGSIVSSSVQTVGAGGQLAKLGKELFPDALAGGWVQATSSVSNLRGFWLGGDWTNFGDGAESATPVTEFVFPIITANSRIDIVNPSAAAQAFVMRLVGSDGQDVGDTNISFFSPGGSYSVNSTDVFDPLDLAQATHAKVTCMATCAGSVLVRDYLAAPSLAVASGMSTAATSRELNFPHIIQGTLGDLIYSTVVSVTSLSSLAQTVSITFTPESGTSSVTVQRDISPGGTVRETPATLFGFTSGFQNGWMKVVSEQPIAGIVVFAESKNRGVAVTPGLSRISNNLVLSHIAELGQWGTGIALLNPSSTAFATVDIFAITPQGTLIGSKTIGITAGGKASMQLDEWIPETRNRATDGGFVFIRSNVPIYGLEVFYTRDLKLLSHVPAFALGATEVFTPPNR
jgi:hypothetical protein